MQEAENCLRDWPVLIDGNAKFSTSAKNTRIIDVET